MFDLGKVIQKMRRKRGLSIGALAKLIGGTIEDVKKVEATQDFKVNDPKLAKIVEALDTSLPVLLLEGTEKKDIKKSHVAGFNKTKSHLVELVDALVKLKPTEVAKKAVKKK